MTNDTSNAASRQSVLDVGALQVGAVYARALWDAAAAAGESDTVVEELDSLVDDVLAVSPNLASFLTSQMVSHDDRAAAIDKAFSGRASNLFINFLKVLSTHGRLDCLAAVRHVLHEIQDEAAGRRRVEVRSAAPLDAAVADRIRDHLRGVLSFEPELVSTVDPELIGGLVVRVGDTVYDGSVSARLEKIREQMIHRSVHEIQSQRDRFSHTE